MRIRTVKPEFWTHPVMGKLEPETQLLALALLNYADDEGYFRAEASLVRSACQPFTEDSGRIQVSLNTLLKVGWIEVCATPENGHIGRIPKWKKHQKISHPSGSKLKLYWLAESSVNSPGILAEDSRSEQGTGNREQGTPKVPKGDMDGDAEFGEFWDAYPKKVKKAEAFKAWRSPAVAKARPPTTELVESVRKFASTEEWQKAEGQFIPHASTWLRGQRWIEVMPSTSQNSEKKEVGAGSKIPPWDVVLEALQYLKSTEYPDLEFSHMRRWQDVVGAGMEDDVFQAIEDMTGYREEFGE